MKMNKLFFLGFAVFLGGIFGFGGAEQLLAANSETIIRVKYQDQEYIASNQLIQSWKKPVKIAGQASILKKQNPSIEQLVSRFANNTDQNNSAQKRYPYDIERIFKWLKSLAPAIEINSQEPMVTIIDGRAKTFSAPAIGKSLDFPKSVAAILNALNSNDTEVNLTIVNILPQTELSETNDLGINELLGRGESKFAGSPNNRRHNIEIGVEKMKGIIIKPGEEFSFNKYLGPVEAEQGFLPELVIRRDKGTVPELGGGLCQVSSTAFRAAMKTGLPIKERRNHAYAVQYYAPQGTDATIYPGIVDLKFENDTPASILVWPYFKDKNTLIFDFYGTKDSRTVELSDPVQYDRKADGSMKAYWNRTLEKNGEKTTETFKSVYLPPALFHKEEKFVSGDNKEPTTTGPSTENILNSPNKPAVQ